MVDRASAIAAAPPTASNGPHKRRGGGNDDGADRQATAFQDPERGLARSSRLTFFAAASEAMLASSTVGARIRPARASPAGRTAPSDTGQPGAKTTAAATSRASFARTGFPSNRSPGQHTAQRLRPVHRERGEKSRRPEPRARTCAHPHSHFPEPRFVGCCRCWILLDFAPASCRTDNETASRVGFLLDFKQRCWSKNRALHSIHAGIAIEDDADLLVGGDGFEPPTPAL